MAEQGMLCSDLIHFLGFLREGAREDEGWAEGERNLPRVWMFLELPGSLLQVYRMIKK